MSKRLLCAVGVCLFSGSISLLPAQEGADPQAFSRAQLDYFEQHVRPVLVKHCIECHGPEEPGAGLRLDSRQSVLKGGSSGPAVSVGKPGSSLLITAVRYDDDDYRMPPEERLSDAEIEALTRWVRTGLAWPQEAAAAPGAPMLGDQEALSELAADHWAFQPLQRPTLPEVGRTEWVQTPVDAFVLRALEQQQLQPAPPADRRKLIRRIKLDLLGLPPTPEEIRAFITDQRPRAVERLIDRFLESPQYGERWGRHWLDIARYADTMDFVNLVDPRYPYAFTYRDYVIRAFNADKPFNEFLKEQLAADQYGLPADAPELAALGFLTVGPRFRNNQPELISDRIDVVTRGLVGLTVGCARCHDHKYDPIPTTDYYALYGVFASCEEPEELPVIAVGNPPPEQFADFERQLALRQRELREYGETLRAAAMEDLHGRFADHLDAYFEINVVSSASVRKLITGGKFKETALTPLGRNLDRIGTDKRWKSDPVLGFWANLIRVPDNQFSKRLEQLLELARQPDERQRVNPRVLAMFESQPPADKREMLSLYGQLFDRVHQATEAHGTDDRPLSDPDLQAIRELLERDGGPFDLPRNSVVQASRLLGKGRQALARYENAIRDVESTHPGAPARAMVLHDKDEPMTASVFIRGDATRRGDRVPRRFLTILSDGDPQPFKHGSGRRELAEAITDPENPLTARVMVNRIWRHHLGRGLVESTDDFGLQTSPPSHPELLDHLATQFIDSGWSVKFIHRLILNSATYQQSVEGNPDFVQIDPENRWYWRANRRRLDFEAMRDSVLAVSGQLDLTLGGRPVDLTEQPFSTRRTVYGFVDRMNLDGLFSTFDFPSPDSSRSSRSETMVPQQALFVMNDPFMVEQSRALSGLPELASEQPLESRLRLLYLRVFGRDPEPRELTAARQFLALPESPSAVAGALVWQYGYGPADLDRAGASEFEPLRHWTGAVYQVGDQFPDPDLGHVRLTRNGGHPGRSLDTAVIRRWTSPVAGPIKISGPVAHLRDRGDGIRAQVVSSRVGVLGSWTAFNDQVPVMLQHTVEVGEMIDFVVDCQRQPTSDAFNWSPVIEQVVSARRAGEMSQKWDAAADFKSPPPPPLNRWEQYCQALLLTNEFLFVD